MGFSSASKIRNKTTDNRTYKLSILKEDGQWRCDICRDWEGCNHVRLRPKHGVKKPKYKNKR